MAKFSTLGLLGCGNMGGSLLRGMITSQKWASEDIYIYDANEDVCQQLKSELKVSVASSVKELQSKTEVIVLGVKPQVFPLVAKEFFSLTSSHLFISIMAGLPCQKISELCGGSVRVVRTMPNLPLSVNAGATAIATDGHDSHVIAGVEEVFDSVGMTVQVLEKQIDAVIGVSGSGPMYVFEFADAMIKAGIESGLEQKVSKELALQTLRGAVALLESDKETPTELTQKVCSPGGTTLAALAVLQEKGFKETVAKAVFAAVNRSIELGKS